MIEPNKTDDESGTTSNRKRVAAIVESGGVGSGALAGFLRRTAPKENEASEGGDEWLDGNEHSDPDPVGE